MLQNTMTLPTCLPISERITPFGGWPPERKRFPTGWKGIPETFEEIMDDLRLHIVNELVYFRRIARHYISDLLQQGWLRLWEALQENASLLASMTCRKAADFVSNRCGTTTFRDYLNRYDRYHEISRWDEADADVFEDSITEIVMGPSLHSTEIGKHALFTRKTDMIIDITAAIREVAEWCGDDMRKLAALYYVTTSVSQVDAGRLAGLPIEEREGRNPKCSRMQYWSKLVLERLQEALAAYKPIEPNCNIWKEQLKAGDTAPVVALAQKYANDSHTLLALYVLTTSVGLHTVVSELGANESALWYAMKKLRQELRCMYARRVLGRA